MKTTHAWSALAIILLGAVAGLLLGRSHPDPKKVTFQSQIGADTIPATQAVTHSTASIQSAREVPVEPSQSKPEIRQPGADLASANLESPVNSQDLDQNREWARNFPADALTWLQTAPDGTQRFAIAEIVCPRLAQTNAAAAVKLAENCLGEGTDPAAQYLLATVAQIWAEQDIQDATAWALAKPDGERDRLLQHIAFAESKTNPDEAARLISQEMSPGEFQNEAAISVLYQWSRQDAEAALAWAESFSPGELRNRAIKEVKNVSPVSGDVPPMN